VPVFAWEGRTRTGEARSGTIEGANEDAVLGILRGQQINPTKVRKKAKEFSLSFGGVPKKDLVVFTRQFATMIDAGLPLVQCLDILSSQTANKSFAKILTQVKLSVESGATFSESLKKHPKAFDELYVNLVAAGEVGGILDTILNRLAQYIEKSVKLARQVKGAMVYPIGVCIVAIVVMIVMLVYVIPVFENMFKDMGAGSLPALTKFVIGLSKGFITNIHWFLLGAFALVAGFVATLRTRKGRWYFDSIMLKIPIIGPVLRKIAVARFTRTLGTLLSSGVPILDALDIVARTAGNVVIAAAIRIARQKISEGKDLATPLMESKVFPPMVVQMIGVGEQTGAMDAMLQKIADFYDEEVDVAVAALTSLLEPIMMVFLGGVMGTLVISMYMPIFEMAGAIKGN